MTELPMFYVPAPALDRVATVPELTSVSLTREARTDDGAIVPSGATGTIVGVWLEGEAYEVEFTTPVAGLATVPSDAVKVRSRSAS